MEIINGIEQKGSPYTIEECSRDDLPKFFVQMGYKIGAEIGVYKGINTKRYLDAGLKMYAIDPWHRRESYFKESFKLLDSYDDMCLIIREESMSALRYFKDESLDFVYIDGNHTFRYVAEDIVEWSKKVKSGGVVSGHDYYNTGPNSKNVICDVQCVVDAYIRANGIKNWYLFGRKKATGEELKSSKWQRDNKWLSWLWIKE